MDDKEKETDYKGGFIMLHRKMLNWGWYSQPTRGYLFIHCLLKANYKTKKWRKITIPRGSFITTYRGIAQETGLSYETVRSAIKDLSDTGEISKKSTHCFTMISVLNYDDYQSNDHTPVSSQSSSDSESQSSSDSSSITTQRPHTDHTPTTHTNKGNKGKKKKVKKEKYLDDIYLTDNQYISLMDTYGNRLEHFLEMLNNYKMSNGKNYKSDYHVMKGWIFDKFKKEQTSTPEGIAKNNHNKMLSDLVDNALMGNDNDNE